MTTSKTIAIIGGGLIGAATALVLANEGHRVTVYEAGDVGHGCSWGNGAQYNAGSSFPMTHPGVVRRALRWLVDSQGPVRFGPRDLVRNIPWILSFLNTGRMANWVAAYDALHAVNQPCEALYREFIGEAEFNRLFRPNGSVHVWRSEMGSPLDTVTAQLRRARNVSFQPLSASDIRDLEPALSSEYKRGMYFGGSGHVISPVALVEVIMNAAVGRAVSLRRERVLGVLPSGQGAKVRTAAGESEFDKVVVAAGIASRDIAKSLGFGLALASERGYHVTYQQPEVTVTRPVTDAESAFVATPLDTGLRFVGIAEFDHPDMPFRQGQVGKLQSCALAMAPGINVSEATTWMGIRPSTPDSLPIIGAHPKHPNIVFATGHGHMGISGAPMTALLVGDLVAGRAPRLDVTPYRVR
jgi:glycine/D-amino acid oxidase-like deaminating enzyme